MGEYADLKSIRRPTDIVTLAFAGCYLALGVVYGEDAATEPWCSIGEFPFAGDADSQTFTVAKEEVVCRLRQLKPWAEFTSQEYHSKLTGILRDLDHFTLAEKLGTGGPIVEELRQLFALSNYTSVHGRKAA